MADRDTSHALPEILGLRITEDRHGNICLNDLWRAAGSPKDLRPSNWHRQKRTQALDAALRDRIMSQKHNRSEKLKRSTYYVRGRGGAALTFAHPVLALEYAENLNPDLGVEVKTVFLRYRADDISLANDIMGRIAAQVAEDEIRVRVRGEQTIRNRELGEQGKAAGRHTGWQYAELHNSGYRGLYDGRDAADIKRLKEIPADRDLPDFMGAAEGAANAFRVTQAALAMQRLKPETPEQAFVISGDAGLMTRKSMEFGGVMPEDMKPADDIRAARKRLAQNRKIIDKD